MKSPGVLCALAVHAERRADELLASSEVVRAAGVDPLISHAGSEVLRAVAALGLRDAFGLERPADAHQVLRGDRRAHRTTCARADMTQATVVPFRTPRRSQAATGGTFRCLSR